MNSKTLQELSLKFNSAKCNILINVDMKKRTTMQTGGIAPLVIESKDVSSLITALRILRDEGVPYFTLGGGSNLIAGDGGFDCAVISTRQLDAIRHTAIGKEKKATVTAGAGTSMQRLVEYCTAHCLEGMEQFAGLPGTVGGAVYMNARCFEREISDVLTGADYADGEDIKEDSKDVKEETQNNEAKTACYESKISSPSNSIILVQHYDMNKRDWSYKVSPFQGKKLVITQASFMARQADENMRSKIDERCKGYIEERRAKGHFLAPSSGSVFRNNRAFGKPSGALIDEAGLKGMKIGGAQIAPWHGNIIINTGNASSSDIIALIKAAHDKVQEATGFDMQCEVVFCGKE